MKTITITRTTGEKIKRYLFDITKENCPICNVPLKDSSVSWNMFHGEVNRHCCNSPWQIKDFGSPDGEEETYKKYFKELNKKNVSELKIPKDLWKPLAQAMKKHGVQSCKDDNVYNEIKDLIKK